MNVNKRVTTSTRPTVVGIRGSSTDDSEGASVIDEGPPRRACNSVDPDTSPPRHLLTKLVEQNARLKNFARQLIADRGMTVAQYLVRLRHLCIMHLNTVHLRQGGWLSKV